jgi:hypothetical protein
MFTANWLIADTLIDSVEFEEDYDNLFSSGDTIFSTAYVCPKCGNLWARHVICPDESDAQRRFKWWASMCMCTACAPPLGGLALSIHYAHCDPPLHFRTLSLYYPCEMLNREAAILIHRYTNGESSPCLTKEDLSALCLRIGVLI